MSNSPDNTSDNTPASRVSQMKPEQGKALGQKEALKKI